MDESRTPRNLSSLVRRNPFRASLVLGLVSGSVSVLARLIIAGSVEIMDFFSWAIPVALVAVVVLGPARGGVIEAATDLRSHGRDRAGRNVRDRLPLMATVIGIGVATGSSVIRFTRGATVRDGLDQLLLIAGVSGLVIAMVSVTYSLTVRRGRNHDR